MDASSTASAALTLQFLAWVAEGPRTYGEAMEAWRSTCPRLSIWEDAVRDGLVRLENGGAIERLPRPAHPGRQSSAAQVRLSSEYC
jgi:hypothetical protein